MRRQGVAPPLLSISTEAWQPVSKDVQPSLFVDKCLDPAVEEDVAGLEMMRALDLQRRELVCPLSPIRDIVQPRHLEQLASYVGKVHALAIKPGLEDKVETSWTSPLAGKPNQHFRVKGLKNEAAMAASLLASSLQIYAHAQLKGSSSSQDQGSSQAASHPSAGSGQAHDHQQQPQSEEGAACAAAALHFRQAAGVYEWLAEWTAQAGVEQPPNSKPAELSPDVARTLAMVCCGLAQAVVSVRAEQRQSAPALLTSLYVGAWELLEKAALQLKELAGKGGSISESLRRFLAITAGLCHARALCWWAEHQRVVETQAGRGEACCIKAASLLKQCEAAAQGSEWHGDVEREQSRVEAFRVKSEHERIGVFYQTIPKAAPELPASKVLARALPWTPEQPLSTSPS